MSQPDLWGEMKAMFREAVNDIRGTFMQSWFGQPEHPMSPGTPMAPTQFMVNEDLKVSKPEVSRFDELERNPQPAQEPERDMGMER